jgi:hypothetical protein
MRRRSLEYPGCSEKSSKPVEFLLALLLLSAMGAFPAAGPAHSAAVKEIAADVAYVEDVSGHAVAFSQGKPALLDALDILSDRTRLDLQANSELRICHYRTHQLLVLKGPLRASVSADGVAVENGKAVVASAGACAAPVVSTFQGGLVARGLRDKMMNVPLRPSIKVVNRGMQPIRQITLWDGESQRILMTFGRDAARPILEDDQSYALVVERNDGSEFTLMLRGSAVTGTDPVILVLR